MRGAGAPWGAGAGGAGGPHSGAPRARPLLLWGSSKRIRHGGAGQGGPAAWQQRNGMCWERRAAAPPGRRLGYMYLWGPQPGCLGRAGQTCGAVAGALRARGARCRWGARARARADLERGPRRASLGAGGRSLARSRCTRVGWQGCVPPASLGKGAARSLARSLAARACWLAGVCACCVAPGRTGTRARAAARLPGHSRGCGREMRRR